MTDKTEDLTEWTVMVYLAGDNNLSEECVWSLKEMYRAGLAYHLNCQKVALVVQIDPRGSKPQLYDVGMDLEELQKNSPLKLVNASVPDVMSDDTDGLLSSRGRKIPPPRSRATSKSGSARMATRPKNAGDIMSSPDALTGFIVDSKNRHQAKRYLLILAGHGGGALGHSFLVDDFPATGLNMAELRRALEDAGGGISVLGMDSCSMGMAEVGFELRNSVKYLVAAEGFELNTGWPYHKLLKALSDDPEITPRDLAIRIVDDYTSYYSDYVMAGVSTDITACDLGRSNDLAVAVGKLATALNNHLPNGKDNQVEELKLAERAVADAVLLAHWRAQSYRFEEYTDLLDFCNLLQKGSSEPKVGEACKDVERIIVGTTLKDGSKDGYVVRSGRTGGAFQHSNGVSIYFPWAIFLKEYRKLSFSRKAGWGKFLEACVEGTRRQPRPGFGDPIPVPQADDSASVIRESSLLNSRDSSLLNSRDSSLLNSRDSALLNSRGGKVIVPQVKNPPVVFFQGSATKEESGRKKSPQPKAK